MTMTFVRLLRAPTPTPPPPAPKIELPPTIIYTDGGCNPKKNSVGAWAWRSTRPGREPREMSEAMLFTTTNRMELAAVISALEHHDGDRVTIYSDSKYVVNGLLAWNHVWVQRGWKTFDGAEVKNRDLWEMLLPLAAKHKPELHHVKGHSGVAGNEYVDHLCTQTMYALYARWEAGEEVACDASGVVQGLADA